MKKYNLITSIIIVSCMIFMSYKDIRWNVEDEANSFMNYCNRNHIKAGCFYMKNDTIIITKKNF